MKHGRPIAGIAIRSAIDGKRVTVGTQQAREWITASKLLPDQADAALLTLTTPKWASAIEGLAGTTKTTRSARSRNSPSSQGWTVRGFGATSGSVNALTDAGIESRTIAKPLRRAPAAKDRTRALDSGRIEPAGHQTGQLAAETRPRPRRRAHRVRRRPAPAPGDRSGHPVRQFLADNMAVARLTTIRRQQDPELRRAVELAAAEHIPEAVDLLTQQKRVIAIPDPAKRYERIAADYLERPRGGPTLPCCRHPPTMNARPSIRPSATALVAHRYVASIGQEHQILIPRDMTPAQLQDARSYHEGDVLYFSARQQTAGHPQGTPISRSARVSDRPPHPARARTAGRSSSTRARSRESGPIHTETRIIAVGDRLQWREPDNHRRIANGEYATITKLDQHQIEVQLDKGRKLSMPLADARKVDLGYATTTHAAQGSTVDRVIANIDAAGMPGWSTSGNATSRFPGLASTPAFIPTMCRPCGARSRARRKRNWRSRSRHHNNAGTQPDSECEAAHMKEALQPGVPQTVHLQLAPIHCWSAGSGRGATASAAAGGRTPTEQERASYAYRPQRKCAPGYHYATSATAANTACAWRRNNE